MKFRSPTTESVSVGLTSGHMAVVTPEPVELGAIFHREAIALGCIPEGVAAAVSPSNTKTFDRALVIGEALQAAIDEGKPEDFKQDGMPDLGALAKRVGFKVSREEADAIWAEVSKG